MTLSLKSYLSALSQETELSTIMLIGRGIEREALRITADGMLSEEPHSYQIGSALTHPHITTDYSEVLLEFITPVSYSAQQAVEQLQDIQKFTLSKVEGEYLWPLSMPCFVNDEDKVPLAYYGQSNIGQMKTVYRQGLKNRYGSMMQVIAGIHFNFSFSDDFWRTLQTVGNNKDNLTDFKSVGYFALIRNYKRYCWLIPYLFGSSPILCPSFLQDSQSTLPFKKSASGAVYLPYATSLRMSDLGYTNSAQSNLSICYNNLSGYLGTVQKAMSLSSEQFAKIPLKSAGKYQQLNSNVLQIENELYAPIRPKRVAESGEKPSHALASRGVEYIEVRALDVNPFVDSGISVEQVYFLDVFLTYCALAPSAELSAEELSTTEKNMDEVVVRGRDPQLHLIDQNKEKLLSTWGDEIFIELSQVAKLLDKAHGGDHYSQAVIEEHKKILAPELTPSAQLLTLVVDQKKSLSQLALSYADDYKQSLISREYQSFTEQYFNDSVEQSHQNQITIEDADTVTFDAFLADYFSEEI